MESSCSACHCLGRKLRKLNYTDFVDIYSQILSEISVYITPSEVQICWLCCATLKQFHTFKETVKSSYLTLQHGSQLLSHQRGLSVIHQLPISITGDEALMKQDTDYLDLNVQVKLEETSHHEEPETFVNELPLQNEKHSQVQEQQEGDSAIQHRTGQGETRADIQELDTRKLKKKDKKKKPKVKKKTKLRNKTGKKSNEPPSLKCEDSNSIDNCDNDNISLEETPLESDKRQTETEHVDDGGKTETADNTEPVEKVAVKPAKMKRSSEVLPDRPTCQQCGKIFSSKKTYRYHMSVLHNGHDQYPCSRCDKVFHWKSNLGRHMRSHKAADLDELHCVECDKRFASIATYRQHLNVSRRHVAESELRYQCTHCHKRFRTRTTLRDHVDWDHLQRIKFTCTLCHKPFKCHTSLYVHKQNVHRDKDKKDNLCHVCGKSYQNSAKLKYHIVAMHTAQTPYQCAHCEAAFGWYSSLYRHVREVHYKMKTQQKKGKRSRREAPAHQPPEHTPTGMEKHTLEMGAGLTLPQLLASSMAVPNNI